MHLGIRIWLSSGFKNAFTTSEDESNGYITGPSSRTEYVHCFYILQATTSYYVLLLYIIAYQLVSKTTQYSSPE
jgi:hypothetical protein